MKSQRPGSLPVGATLDSLLTLEEFCVWQRCGRTWFAARRHRLPGVVQQSRKAVRIHPRSYLDGAVRRSK